MISGRWVSLHQESDRRIPGGVKRPGGCPDEIGSSYHKKCEGFLTTNGLLPKYF